MHVQFMLRLRPQLACLQGASMSIRASFRAVVLGAFASIVLVCWLSYHRITHADKEITVAILA